MEEFAEHALEAVLATASSWSVDASIRSDSLSALAKLCHLLCPAVLERTLHAQQVGVGEGRGV